MYVALLVKTDTHICTSITREKLICGADPVPPPGEKVAVENILTQGWTLICCLVIMLTLLL